MQPKEWNSSICTNLTVSLIRGNFSFDIDVSETVPNLNSAVNASGGTNKIAYTSIGSVFGAMIIAEIVIYEKRPRTMRFNLFDHRFVLVTKSPDHKRKH